mgnify:FL=1
MNSIPADVTERAALAIAQKYSLYGDDARHIATAALTAAGYAELVAERDELLSLHATSNLFIQAVSGAASDTGWRKDGDETPGIADWIRLVVRERDRARAALTALMNVYAELHALYDLGDCDATVEARRALGKSVLLFRQQMQLTQPASG